MHVIVLAKAPVPGRVKTRLVPPYTHHQAAALAEAALSDTIEVALSCGADEVIVALEGQPGPWLPPGCRLLPQRGARLDERLAAAWDDAGGPGIQIGMDAPQLTSDDLDAGLAALAGADSALGLAEDGGWWAIALDRPDPRVFLGVPMSRPDTGTRQLGRLRSLGLSTARLRVLRDVDTAADVRAVAALAPTGRFAAAARTLEVPR